MNISEISQKHIPLAPARPADAENAKIAASSVQDSDKLEQLSKKFEGLLLHQMFKQAQQTIDQISEGGDDEESSQDAGTEQYQSLYWTQMADVVSEQGGLGLWKTIHRQLQQQAENAQSLPGRLDELK